MQEHNPNTLKENNYSTNTYKKLKKKVNPGTQLLNFETKRIMRIVGQLTLKPFHSKPEPLVPLSSATHLRC